MTAWFKHSSLSIFVTLLALVLASPAFAQVSTGSLRGEIVDQADAALAGVKLKLTSDSLQGERLIDTDEDGLFRFLALPPGTYRLDVEKEGFKSIIRTNLGISMGRSVNIKLVMELPEVGETVEIIDRRPLVDTESNTNRMTLNSDFLENLPSGRSFQDAVQFLPGVTGGANPMINGGTSQSNQYYLDGAQTTDPVLGTFSMNFNFDAIEDLEVITSGYDARYSQGLGGTINIVTKSGGNTFEGSFNAYYETSRLTAGGDAYTSLARTQSDAVEANASLGGPIIKDRFWFFLSYRYQWTRNLPGATIDIGRDFAQFPLNPRVWQSHQILGKLTAQPFARNKFTLTFRTDPTSIRNVFSTGGGSVFTVGEAQALWRQGGFGATLQHEIQIGGRAVLTTTAAYSTSNIFIQPMGWQDCTDRDAGGICTDPDKQQIPVWGGFGRSGPGLNHNSYGQFDQNQRHNIEVRTDFELGLDRLLGSHTVQAGAAVNPIWSRREFGYVGNQIQVRNPVDADNSGFFEANEVSDLDSYVNSGRFLIVNERNSTTPGLRVNAYIQERWSPTRGLTFNVGARYAHSNLRNNQRDTVFNYHSVGWGGGVVWDPFRDGKTALRLSAASFVDPGLLVIASYVNQSDFNFEFYPWEADQQRWGEASTRAASPASDISHPDLVVPRQNEISVSVEREIARDMSARVNFLYRDFTNGYEDDEVNVLWNHDGTDAVGFRNGADEDVLRLRTPQDGFRNYWQAGLVVTKQLSDNFTLRGDYTYSRLTANTAGRGFTDGINTPGSNDFNNPTQRWQENGVSTADVPHVVQLQATYDNPNVWKLSERFSIGYSIGGVFRFSSGQPLNQLQWNVRDQSYSNYVHKRGTEARLAARADLDLRGALALKIAGTQVELIVQAFNVLNSLQPTNGDGRAIGEDGEAVTRANGAPVFASPSNYQAPRRFEFGARFTF